MSKSWVTTEGENDDIRINHRISILADPFAMKHFHSIRYVEWMGVKWKVTSVDPTKYPRLTLTLGEQYNGEIEQDIIG